MACATPVVASDLPPARAVLEPIARGSVVPVGDAPSLAAVLRRVMAMSAGDRRRLGDALRGHVVQVADYEANMARMEGLYRRLAGRA
jgi:glycosyltransferase involved in cell wall biosynthesis